MADSEAAVRRRLDELGATYEVIECDPDLADTLDFVREYGYPVEKSANAIVVAGKPRPDQEPPFAVCVVLATTRLDVNRVVRKRLDVRKASFASADDTMLVTGMMIGGVTPFGLDGKLPLWVDTQVVEHEWVIVGGGSRSCKIKVDSEVFARMPEVDVVEGLATA